jgi:hypothetical protein
MKNVMKKIADNTWILLQNGDRTALINLIDDKPTVIGNLSRKDFSTLDQLTEFLGGVTYEEIEQHVEKEEGNIEGYPIRHSEFFDVMTDPVPSYTKTDRSRLRYAAGYYMIKFPQGWTAGFCPKLSTLVEYEYQGPYMTKLEMQHAISSKNREIKI